MQIVRPFPTKIWSVFSALRNPPINLQAEQLVIGALLANGADPFGVTRIVRARAFFDPVHAELYATIAARLKAGEPITLQAIAGRTAIQLLDVGGAIYLEHVRDAAAGALPAEITAAAHSVDITWLERRAWLKRRRAAGSAQ